ncbi:hypothetical protein YC2023_010369 [Brassica napus]
MKLICLIYNKYQIISQKKKLRKNKSTEMSLFPVMVRSIAHEKYSDSSKSKDGGSAKNTLKE